MSTYVVIEAGGKQYRVSKDDTIETELLGQAPGKALKLDKVLLYSDGKKLEIGRPYLKNVKVNCEVLAQVKGKKTVSYKYKRRKDQKTKIGHRQKYTRLRVREIKID